ncbi:hypothetical protein ATANTOWER_028786 [Ataeniobius toweri]|uniref:Uncharacterized protein n=1 Tax=Ataeniobius toweri TaxID=208326 RepID=A0ABU7BC57_9TELE|nr:hypothetical protein [Ataeniobius toweri]
MHEKQILGQISQEINISDNILTVDFTQRSSGHEVIRSRATRLNFRISNNPYSGETHNSFLHLGLSVSYFYSAADRPGMRYSVSPSIKYFWIFNQCTLLCKFIKTWCRKTDL